MAANYTELQAEIANYLGRTDLAAVIPTFIQQAEATINRELRLKAMEKISILQAVAGNRVLPLPNRRDPGDWDVFLEMRDLRLDMQKMVNLDYLTPEALPTRQMSGIPQVYTIVGKDLILYPTPQEDCNLELIYYAEVPPLGDSQPDNEVLLTMPDMYLYGSLVKSAGYARSTVPLELWAALYQQAAQGIDDSDESGRFTANLASRPIRCI